MFRLLVALDFSDLSPLTLRTALEVVARVTPSELHIMTVVAPGHDDVAVMGASENACDALRRLVEVERTLLAPAAGLRLQFSAPAGSAPAETIIAHALAVHADAIVVGSHGRRGLDRLLLGSVAEAIVRRSPCSVLTVKQRLHSRPEG